MRRFGFMVGCLVLSIIFVAPDQTIWAQPSQPNRDQPLTIAASTLIEDLQALKDRKPQISPRELAGLANQLLDQKGFPYIFEVCKFLSENGKKLSDEKGNLFYPFAIQLKTVSGERKTFQIRANEASQAKGKCLTAITAFKVSNREMTVLVNGQPVRLQRPPDFRLDQIELVDQTLKKVIRQWETPFLKPTLGVSADGTKLYQAVPVSDLAANTETFDEFSELALELSQDGGLRFRAREELKLKAGHPLKNLPKETANRDVIFIRFLQNRKPLIVKSPFNPDPLGDLLPNLLISGDKDIYPIQTKPLNPKNPTSYEFPGSLPEVREKILKAFKDFELMRTFYPTFSSRSGFHFSIEGREDAVFSKEIFDNPENKNDLYLHSFGEVIGASPIYYGGGKPLKYRATFQLRLTSLGENRTKVSVITHDPRVINGSVCCGLHGYKSNDVAVEPTTIEEYKILRFIGSILGVNNLPALRLPEGIEK